jgi:hypothetical protein
VRPLGIGVQTARASASGRRALGDPAGGVGGAGLLALREASRELGVVHGAGGEPCIVALCGSEEGEDVGGS